MTEESNLSALGRRKRLSIVINTIAPYRLPIYAALAETFDTTILHGGDEANRSWNLVIPENLNSRKVWTIQLRLRKQTGIDNVFDIRHFHLNLGLLWQLPLSRPDVIVSNELGVRTLLCMAYAQLYGIDHWIWWGGTVHSERNISGFKKIFRGWIAASIDRWISYGRTSTEYLQSIGVRARNVLQIQNCVPHENFLVHPLNKEPWFVGEPRPIILAVGQLIARKGLGKLVEACGRLAAEGHVFTLVLVGNGPDREKLREQAAEAGIAHLHLIPNQPQHVLNELYRVAQVFVFPTMEDVWGLVVNEAIWAGVPVLCSCFAGCAPEIVAPENVFDPTDPESFDAALRKVFDGTVQPSDARRLATCRETGETIARSILARAPIS